MGTEEKKINGGGLKAQPSSYPDSRAADEASQPAGGDKGPLSLVNC